MNLKKVYNLVAILIFSSYFTGCAPTNDLVNNLKEAVDGIAISTGVSKIENKSDWFSPPYPIKNTNVYGEESFSRARFDVTYMNFLANPVMRYSSDYTNEKEKDSNHLKTFEDYPKYIKTVNYFKKNKNSAEDYVVIELKTANNTSSDNEVSANGINLGIYRSNKLYDAIARNLSEIDLYIYLKNESKKIDLFKSKITKEFEKGIPYNTIINNLDTDGTVLLYIELKIPGINKKYYQKYLIDTMNYKTKTIYEKISLIEENISEAKHPDDIRNIKVYMPELVDLLQPYKSKEILNDKIAQKLVNISNAVFYSDEEMKYYIRNSKESVYIPYKGFIGPYRSFSKKNDMLYSKYSVDNFLNNMFYIDNKFNSKFISKWNRMVSNEYFLYGGILPIDFNGKIMEIDLLNLYREYDEKNPAKDLKILNSTKKHYFNQNIRQNIAKLFDIGAPDINKLLRNATKLTLGEHNYTYLSFNEYAATWGLTSTEAKKLFYFKNGQFIWKYDGLKKYLLDHNAGSFINFKSENIVNSKNLDTNKSEKLWQSTLIDNLSDHNMDSKFLMNIYSKNENKYLMNLIDFKTKKPFSLFKDGPFRHNIVNTITYEICLENTKPYPDSIEKCKIARDFEFPNVSRKDYSIVENILLDGKYFDFNQEYIAGLYYEPFLYSKYDLLLKSIENNDLEEFKLILSNYDDQKVKNLFYELLKLSNYKFLEAYLENYKDLFLINRMEFISTFNKSKNSENKKNILIVEKFIEQLNKKNKIKERELYKALQNFDLNSIWRLIKKENIRLSTDNGKNHNELTLAIELKNYELFIYLIKDMKLNLDEKGIKNLSPLEYALKTNQKKFIAYFNNEDLKILYSKDFNKISNLISKDIDVNFIPKEYEKTALNYYLDNLVDENTPAYFKELPEVVSLLLKKGATIDKNYIPLIDKKIKKLEEAIKEYDGKFSLLIDYKPYVKMYKEGLVIYTNIKNTLLNNKNSILN